MRTFYPYLIKATFLLALSLVVVTAAPPKAHALNTNIVLNPSVEEVDPANPAKPTYWNPLKTGTNNATHTYEKTGRTGTRSLKVAITQHINGAARWYFSPRSVTPGVSYKYTNYYKSNVTTKVVVQYIYTDGTKTHVTLGTVGATADWRQASFQFVPPTNVRAVTVMHALDKLGHLTIDDVSLIQGEVTDLSRGLVSLTFDDAWRSIYIHALPLLTKYNMKSTQYVNTNPVKVATLNTTSPYPYMMPAHVKEFHAKGHEIASHSVNHPNLTQVSLAELNYQLTESKRYLTALTGVAPKNFASPYGASNTTTQNAIMKLYRSNRSYDGAGYVRPDTLNIRNITTRNVYKTTTTDEVKAWIDHARANKVWAVLVFHDIDPNPRTYGYTPAGLEVILSHLKATSTPVVTVDRGLDIVQSTK